jgi:predicted RNase H-like nuclease
MKILFTGFDSAWGGRQRGAICNLAGETTDGRLTLRVREQPESVNWAQAVALARASYVDDPNHVMSIDQGLVVPNATGMRPVERLLASALMGAFGCGAHASNHGRASCYGPRAGIWDFIETLEQRGYRHEPLEVAGRPEGRFFFECYPHPALIGLFNLDRTLPYKVTRGTAAGWQQLLGHLRSLEETDLPILNVKDHVPVELAWTKPNEDQLDALIAAYIAAYFWWFGTARSIVLGSLTEGYIVTPCNDRTRKLFMASFGEHGVNPKGAARILRPASGPSASPVPALPNVATAIEPPAARASQDGLVDLVASDTGCLWCNRNTWMQPDRCVGWRLVVEFPELDGEPVLTFVPFANQGAQQGGMKPSDDDTRLEWKFIAAGATGTTPQTYRVRFEYQRLAP